MKRKASLLLSLESSFVFSYISAVTHIMLATIYKKLRAHWKLVLFLTTPTLSYHARALTQPWFLCVAIGLVAYGSIAFLVLNLLTRLTLGISKNTVIIVGTGVNKIIEEGSEVLDKFDNLRTSLPLRFDNTMPMMAMATVEHRSPAQLGLIRYTDNGGDDDGDSYCAKPIDCFLTYAERRVLFGHVLSMTAPGGEVF